MRPAGAGPSGSGSGAGSGSSNGDGGGSGGHPAAGTGGVDDCRRQSGEFTSVPPYQHKDEDANLYARHLREVFAAIHADGSKEVLFVRACAPTADKGTDADRCTVFKHWHPPEVAASGVDPCLTDLACLSAGDGLPPEALKEPPAAAAGGLEGGLRGLLHLFAPEVVVTSPHSSAIQTALIACTGSEEVAGEGMEGEAATAAAAEGPPIIVHPDLKHIKKDFTLGGEFPKGKPKFQGVPTSQLAQALAQPHPYARAAKRVDLSLLEEVWFDPKLEFKGQKRKVRNVVSFLAARPEQRILVITHNRVLRHLVGAKVGNGQYALARLDTSGDLYTLPTISSYEPRFDSHGDEDDVGVGTRKRVMFVRHCQDEVLPVVDARGVSARFNTWHSSERRAADTEEDGRRDPCLTELGIHAASTGIDESVRTEMNTRDGYGGVRGGLQQIMHSFDPQLVVTSPLARAVQTTIVTFDHSSVPVVVHPHIKELKKDYTFGGRFPNGKPGCSGVPLGELRDAIARHARASGAPLDTTSCFEESMGEHWFDPMQSHADQLAKLKAFTRWLADRPEQRIVVVSHGGVLRHLVHTELGHGQYVITEVHQRKKEKQPKFVVVQFSAGVQPYYE